MWPRRCALAVLVCCTPVPVATAETFPVPAGANNLVFDGQNIWVGSNTALTKLRESDGAFLGAFTAEATDGMTFDGANVWWSRLAGDIPFVGYCVGKTRASDGALLGCFLALTQIPRGLAFDGAHVWAAVENGTVVKIRASDNALVGTFAVGADPFGVVFDGANVWVSATGSGYVRKFRASDGLDLGAFPAGPTPAAMAFDGTNIWVVNLINSTVTKLRASDGANLGSFFAGFSSEDVAVHGANVFVANRSSRTLSALRASDGGYLGAVALGGGPSDVLPVGSHLWVANGGGSHTVSKLDYPFAFIANPPEMATFAVGQTLFLRGHSIDFSGELPDSLLSWTVVLRHDTHTHTVFGPVTGNNIPFVAPPPEGLEAVDNSDLEVRLTVTLGGSSTTVTRSVRPRKVPLTFATTPPGLSVIVNGSTLVGPQTVNSWQNYQLVATAPPWQQVGPDLHVFSSWSVGPANPVVIATPSAHTTYTASYQLSTDSGPQGYYTIAPCRLVDTRLPVAPLGGPPLQAGVNRAFVAWGACGIPPTARALAVNLAVTSPDGPGHLRIFPADVEATGTSTAALSFGSGQTRGSNTLVRLAAGNGGFIVFNGMSSGSTHFVLDVFGYFE